LAVAALGKVHHFGGEAVGVAVKRRHLAKEEKTSDLPLKLLNVVWPLPEVDDLNASTQ
jgi:hypothetical protein